MTKVKICGLMNQASVEATVAAGADYLGFVFAPSKRQVTPECVRKITQNVPENVKKVGVFVSPSFVGLQRIIEIAELDVIQIHGEIPSMINQVITVPLIQALDGQANDLSQQIMRSRANSLLLDAPSNHHQHAGGNGQVFDWSVVARKTQQQLQQKQFWVAGGLSAKNVQAAIHYFQPYGVDVSSAVETNSVKDIQKIQAFIQAVRG